MSDIIVKFKPSGQKEIVTAIKAIQAAEKNLTVAGKKHNVVVANMTAKLKAQNKTWKDLGVSYTIVGKAAKGNRVAMQQLSLAMKKAKKSGNGLLTTNRLLDNSFATMRSHMLLFNFAMGLGVRQVAKFTGNAAKVESMERAFNTLAGGSANATVAIDKLQEATNGTLSEFDLFQQANNAMVLGVTKNSDEMADMFDMAQRLGSALGKDTAHAVESLVTGIGRQSRLMLDNIGIVVKSEEAYEQYAIELKKNVNQLTDSEKKQAFMNATLDAAREKLQTLPKEVLNADQRFQALGASFADAGVSIGEAFLPMAEALAIALTTVANALTEERVKALATVIVGSLVVAMAAYHKQVMRVVLAQTRLGWGALATAVGFVAAEVLVMTGMFDDSEQELQDFNATASETSVILQDIGRNFVETIPDPEMIAMQDLLTKEYEKTTAAQMLALEVQIEYARALALNGDLTQNQIDGLIALEEKWDDLANKRKKGAKEDIKWSELSTKQQLGHVSNLLGAFGALAGANGQNAKIAARFAQGAAIVDTYAGANKAFAQGGTLGFVTAAAIIAQGLANVARIEQQIGKMGGSGGGGGGASAPLSFMEQGGYVGGNRHAQGGTIIEAERGEFVMSRNAVESIGLETLNQMNQTGGGGNINVSVTGNVLTQDFVEGELAESIKEAVRRGSDFGLG